MIIAKHTNHDGQTIIAVIDDELLGKNYETEELQLDFSQKFYSGTKAEPATIIEEIKKSYMAVCAGNETVGLLVEQGFIGRDDVNIIAGIPYVYITLPE
ncbi:MAG: DUF424 family protein [Candidatus Woesearchaeota archaeon]